MVRGRITNGLVKISAFLHAAEGIWPRLANPLFADSNDLGCGPNSIIDRSSELNQEWLLGQASRCVIQGKNKFHKINVRLEGFCGGIARIKSSRLSGYSIPPVFDGREYRTCEAGRACLIFDKAADTCVRGPPQCDSIYELHVRSP